MSTVAGIVLLACGVLLAVISAFLVPLRLWGDVEGLSVVLVIAMNLGVGLAAGRGLRSPWAAAAPGIGWFVTAAWLSFQTPRGGGVLIPGKLGNDPGVVVVGWLWLLAGIAAAGCAVGVTAFRARTSVLGLHQSGERAEA